MADVRRFRRKRVKHFNHPGHAHELTFSCYHRWPLLDHDETRFKLSTAIDRAVAGHGFDLIAFVYMPEHVHLIVFPNRSDTDIADLLYAIKRPHAYRVKKWMIENRDPRLPNLMIRERPGKTTFRFWQEGPGYDRSIDSATTLHRMIDYVHANPIRRHLCHSPDQWRWSSWHHYEAERVPDGLPTVHGLPEGELI
ncbi:MAG: hypothetical protein GC159_20600 [Phycisphaera sp.]|nr:hypothetical protein [Phycisphaera sp.]